MEVVLIDQEYLPTADSQQFILLQSLTFDIAVKQKLLLLTPAQWSFGELHPRFEFASNSLRFWWVDSPLSWKMEEFHFLNTFL